MYTIKNLKTNEIIYQSKISIKDAIEKAVKQNADLCNADLRNANLYYTNLRNADLRNADLRNADLRNANLHNADLHNADLRNTILPYYQNIPETGSFIAYKKAYTKKGNPVLIKLFIPENGKRTSSLIGRKCRAEIAKVLSITNINNNKSVKSAVSSWDINYIYKLNEIIYPDKYDGDIRIECSHGIHFFITKQEAVEY